MLCARVSDIHDRFYQSALTCLVSEDRKKLEQMLSSMSSTTAVTYSPKGSWLVSPFEGEICLGVMQTELIV